MNCKYFQMSFFEDYRDMLTVKMLETIDLSSNAFDRSIMKPLSKLKSLKNLNLAYNFMIGSFLFHGIHINVWTYVYRNILTQNIYGSYRHTLSLYPNFVQNYQSWKTWRCWISMAINLAASLQVKVCFFFGFLSSS